MRTQPPAGVSWRRESARVDLLAYGLLVGLLVGFATDAIVSAAGA